jgi:hypothetical protein
MSLTRSISISILPGSFAICQLSPDENIPSRPSAASFWSVSVTGDEISVVLPQEYVQPGWLPDLNWRCLKVRGPLNLNQTGVLESIAGPLDEEEMARVRRIGKHIYGKKKG